MSSKSVQEVVVFLNPILTGWWQYFRWGSSGRKAAQVRYYVHERLALFDNGSAAVVGGTLVKRKGQITDRLRVRTAAAVFYSTNPKMRLIQAFHDTTWKFTGALYHLTSRATPAQKGFFTDSDRQLFLDTLARVVSRHGWICHAYCLMENSSAGGDA